MYREELTRTFSVEKKRGFWRGDGNGDMKEVRKESRKVGGGGRWERENLGILEKERSG